jgi:hypothetical protein
LGAHDGENRSSDVHWAKHCGLDLRPELLGRNLLKESGIEITRVINKNVDPAEPLDGGANGFLSLTEICNVERNYEELILHSKRGLDSLKVPPCGDDCVPRSQSSLRDVDAHTAAGPSNEPDLFLNDASSVRDSAHTIELI